MININLKKFDNIQRYYLHLIIFIILFLFMLSITIWASLNQNLLTEFTWTTGKVWFQATLIDFYINQFIIWTIVVYLEADKKTKLVWLIIMFLFGSMGTTLYLIRRILFFSNRPWKPAQD